jgi:hypothetical protein
MRVYPFLKKRTPPSEAKMAIYMLSIKHKAKGKGASATAHAQYIQREGKYAGESHAEYLERGGKHKGRAHELESTWTDNLPEWANSPKQFWETADIYERANGRVYTEVVVALPRELPKDEREKLVREFIDKEIGERFTYTAAIHNPKALDGGEQPHAHIMFSIRERDGIERSKEQYFKRANPDSPEKGGAKKSRQWSKDSRANDRVNEMRSSWEKLTNKALQKAGREERIDRRTLEAQGIDREPEPKMGVEVTQRLKRGQETEIGEKVIEIRKYKEQKKEIESLEIELKKEKAKVYDFDKEKESREGNEFQFTGKKREIPEEERKQYRRTIDLVVTKYKRADGKDEYRWKESGKVAFVDHGDKITYSSISPTAVKAGLQLAKEKGWEGVQVTGSEEFKRESWLQAEMMGVKLTGYKPKGEDFEKLETLQKETLKKKEQYKERQKTAQKEPDRPPASQQSKEPSKGEGSVWMKASELIPTIDKTVKELRARGEPEKKIDDLYRTKYDLKRLGDEKVEVDRAPNGTLRLKDIEKVKARAKELEKNPERKLGLGLTRGRGR